MGLGRQLCQQLLGQLTAPRLHHQCNDLYRIRGCYLVGFNGNEGYDNCIFDMTIDVGNGNPGAEGIHWIGHNTSAIRNVTIKSEDGQGFMGLDMRTQYFGPALARYVIIQGFQ